MNPQVQPALDALRRFAQPRRPETVEQCDLCSAPLGPEHEHLIEPTTRQIFCACQACALLFSTREATRYRRVPREVRLLPAFRLSDAQWSGLRLPIGMAFFFHSTPAGKVVAIYPSPAGPTESLLDLSAWSEIVRDNPVLEQMQSDTQALMVNRVGNRHEYYLTPIDQCYRLVGLIRTHWQGLSGGEEMWTEIGRFFAEMKERSR